MKFVLFRDATGAPRARLPLRIVRHSPTGVDWGRRGSGPKDLALSMLEAALRVMGLSTAHNDECSELAEALSYDFVSEVIVNIPREGAEIDVAEVIDWIKRKGSTAPDASLSYQTHNAPGLRAA